MGRIGGFVGIIRPVNSVMMGVGILVGVIVAAGVTPSVPMTSLALAFAAGFSLTGSAMAINDYFDKEIDAVNEPTRPIPSGEVKPGEAVAFSLALSAVGLAASYATGLATLGIAASSWVVMMAYSVWGKRTGFPGNLMVSTCISLPFIYGGVLAGDASVSLLFGALAFLSNTGREVTKGIVDVEGDGVRGVRTIAVSHGAKAAAYLASSFYLVAAAASITPIVFGLVSIWYVPFVAVTDLGLIYGAASLLRDPSRETSRRVKNQVLYWMLFGLLAFAAGSIM